MRYILGLLTKNANTNVSAMVVTCIAMLFIMSSYFVSKKNYLLLQATGIVFLVLGYLYTKTYFAMVGLGIGIARTCVYLCFERKGKAAPWWIVGCVIIATTAGYFIVNAIENKQFQIADIMFLLSAYLYAIVFNFRDLKLLRYCVLIPTALSIAYNVLTEQTIFTIITYVFEMGAAIVAIFKFYVLPSWKQKTENKKQTQGGVCKECTNENN